MWDKDSHENMAPCVAEIVEYLLNNDEVLLEYSTDFSTLWLIENLIFNLPLTCNGTSHVELRGVSLGAPLRNTWALAARIPGQSYQNLE